MSTPLVSVIIPNYNHARFLNERIQSVLQQTYQNFELIILDDCSPDGGASKAVIESYRDNPHVSHIVYNEINSGSAFKQWGKGFELAQGKYIWIAESDDCCDPELLDTLMGQLLEHQAVMAFCRSEKFDVNGVKSHYDWQDELSGSFVMDGSVFIKKYLSFHNRIANASSVVFRREAAMRVDPFYMQMCAEGDWLFWIMMAEFGRVCFVDNALNFFRYHETNTTTINTHNGISIKEHKHVYSYLVGKAYLNSKESRSLRARLSHAFSMQPFDKETMHEVMRLWDPYHLYRLLYYLYKFKGNTFDKIIGRFSVR